MVKDLMSFSEDGKYFAHCGSDGKLKLWDTATGVLKQEFVPNLHLNSPCSSLTWISVSSSSILPWKNRKRKHEGKSTSVIAMGTAGGAVVLYSFAEAKVISTLQDGHSSRVNCVCWAKDAGLFSVANNLVVQWDIANKSIKSKWKCGKEKITCIVVRDDGEICVTGSYILKLWQVQTQTLIRTLTGHSSDVTNLVFINQHYLLSAASNDRHIAAWSVSGETDDSVGRFALSDALNSVISVTENAGSVHVAAVTRSGVMHIFQQQLNGKSAKSIKPIVTLEIAVEKPTGAGVSSLPVIAAHLTSVTAVTIAYGHMPKFSFESVDIRQANDGRICLVRPESRKPIVNNNKVGEGISEDVEYVTTVNGPVKRKADGNQIDVPMEERLDNLSIDQSDLGGTSKPSPHNMAQLLIQGLESKDKTILESILFRRDPNIIRETVSRLPLYSLNPLIKELSNMLHGKTLMSTIAASWLKCVVAMHAGQLLADAHTCDILTRLHGLMETRLLLLPTLSSLSGRIDLLLQQLQEPLKQNEPNPDALLVYQDEDSSDDGSSLMGEVELSESEDRWEELSDQEVDTEDANMSS